MGVRRGRGEVKDRQVSLIAELMTCDADCWVLARSCSDTTHEVQQMADIQSKNFLMSTLH